MLFCQQTITKAQSHSRPFGSYYNLEKYWFYRYRLINDFMKIGPNCGESMPFGERKASYWGASVKDSTLYTGGEVPIHLGNYIAALASEHRLLFKNGLNTNRTDYEMDLAINAFERMDKNAEAYTFDFISTKSYSNSCQPQNAWSNKLNGYFIRDDVPYQSFVVDNYKHLNRPGSLFKLKKDKYPESALDRYERIKIGTTDPWPPTYAVCVPHEESQDGVVSLALGFSLANRLLGGTSSYLGLKASENLNRMIKHIAYYKPSIHFPDWRIYNPVRLECVYGDVGDRNCASGGGVFSPTAYGAAESNQKWGIFTSGLLAHAASNHWIWQLQQYNVNHADYNFWGTYAALANNWYLLPIGSLIPSWVGGILPPGAVNITWQRMKQFSIKFHEGMPHLPYLYRVMNPGRGANFMFEQTAIKLDMAPPCGIHNYYGDYSNRISWETGGFVHNNGPKGEYSWHWSGSSLIASYYSRDGWRRTESGWVWPWTDGDFDGDGPKDQYVDYNGIDYMVLFNLFSLQDADYIKKMFNSYYRENFDMNFPNSAGLGTASKRLKLNFLEYVSAINKINSDGYFTIRCAKAIDLKPGFEAKVGSKFLAYIEDYHIDCGSKGNETSPPRPSEEYHYAEVNERTELFEYPSMQPNGLIDTSYFLNYPPDGVDFIPDSSSIESQDDTITITCEMAMAYFDSLVATVYASGDPDQIAYIDSLIPYVTFPECDSAAAPSYMGASGGGGANGNNQQNAAGSAYANRLMAKLLDKQKDGTDFNIFPNPNNGNFTVAFANVGEYDIRLYNSLGMVVFQTHVYNRRSEIVHINDLANGVYTAEVVNSTGNPNKKIRKIVIAR